MTSKSAAVLLTVVLCGALHFAPAAEAVDPGAMRAIRDCVLDGDLDRRYPNDVLRRAQQQVPSDYAQYSNCTEVLGAAILDTGATAPPGGGGADLDGGEPGRSASDPGRGHGGTEGRNRSFGREGGSPEATGERGEDGLRTAAGSSAAGFPWLWFLLGGAAVLAAAGLVFRMAGQPRPSGRGA